MRKRRTTIEKRHMTTKISDKVLDISNYIFMTFFMLICLIPFYYIVIYSISDPTQAHRVTLLPIGFTMINYMRVLELNQIYGALVISVLRTVIGTAVTLFCCSLLAYIFSRPEMYLRKFLYRFVVITMFFNAGLIPTYLTFRAYGLRNSFWVYILPFAVNAFFVILIKTFIEQLPKSLEESASLDGAGYFTRYWKIVLPLSKPIIATIAVFSAVNQWNSWFDVFIYNQASPHLYSLQYLLYQYLQRAANLGAILSGGHSGMVADVQRVTTESARMAITVISVIPIMMVYPFLQKYFIKGIMMGAIKG